MRKLLNRKIVEQNRKCVICHEEFTDYSDVTPDHADPKGMGTPGGTTTRTTSGLLTGGATRGRLDARLVGESFGQKVHTVIGDEGRVTISASRSGSHDRGIGSGEPSATNPPGRIARIPSDFSSWPPSTLPTLHIERPTVLACPWLTFPCAGSTYSDLPVHAIQ